MLINILFIDKALCPVAYQQKHFIDKFVLSKFVLSIRPLFPLLINKKNIPDCLEVTSEAITDEQEIMGVQHKEHPVYGVQFHPESILTGEGKKLLNNFLQL